MDRNRKNNRGDQRPDNRVPHGLSFMMWQALVRAPWLLGSVLDNEQRREAERRRKFDR